MAIRVSCAQMASLAILSLESKCLKTSVEGINTIMKKYALPRPGKKFFFGLEQIKIFIKPRIGYLQTFVGNNGSINLLTSKGSLVADGW